MQLLASTLAVFRTDDTVVEYPSIMLKGFEASKQQVHINSTGWNHVSGQLPVFLFQLILFPFIIDGYLQWHIIFQVKMIRRTKWKFTQTHLEEMLNSYSKGVSQLY